MLLSSNEKLFYLTILKEIKKQLGSKAGSSKFQLPAMQELARTTFNAIELNSEQLKTFNEAIKTVNQKAMESCLASHPVLLSSIYNDYFSVFKKTSSSIKGQIFLETRQCASRGNTLENKLGKQGFLKTNGKQIKKTITLSIVTDEHQKQLGDDAIGKECLGLIKELELDKKELECKLHVDKSRTISNSAKKAKKHNRNKQEDHDDSDLSEESGDDENNQETREGYPSAFIPDQVFKTFCEKIQSGAIEGLEEYYKAITQEFEQIISKRSSPIQNVSYTNFDIELYQYKFLTHLAYMLFKKEITIDLNDDLEDNNFMTDQLKKELSQTLSTFKCHKINNAKMAVDDKEEEEEDGDELDYDQYDLNPLEYFLHTLSTLLKTLNISANTCQEILDLALLKEAEVQGQKTISSQKYENLADVLAEIGNPNLAYRYYLIALDDVTRPQPERMAIVNSILLCLHEAYKMADLNQKNNLVNNALDCIKNNASIMNCAVSPTLHKDFLEYLEPSRYEESERYPADYYLKAKALITPVDAPQPIWPSLIITPIVEMQQNNSPNNNQASLQNKNTPKETKKRMFQRIDELGANEDFSANQIEKEGSNDDLPAKKRKINRYAFHQAQSSAQDDVPEQENLHKKR